MMTLQLLKNLAENREDSDGETDWQERESSRTHSVKFSDETNPDKEVRKNCKLF